MKGKRVVSIILCIALLGSVLTGCQGQSAAENDSTAQKNEESVTASAVSAVQQPDEGNAVQIQLDGTDVKISGSGASASGGVVTITKGGVYELTGTLTDGRILVNAPKEEVTLVLRDASVTSSDSSALYIYKAAQVTLWLPEGTASTLTDGESYSFSDEYSSASEEEPDACVYSKADLVVAGSGSLTVNGNYKNGLTSKDTLTLDSVSLTVHAVNHGVCGKDSAAIQNAALYVVTGGDALRSTNSKDETLGWVTVTDSTLELTSGEDGIQAETTLTVSGSRITVTAGGGSGAELSDDASAKGLKAGTAVEITSGEFVLDCADDAVHSNENVTISGGSFEIATGDDGIHADETTAISGGTIQISESYEGIEGKVVEISGGEIDLTASDDGVNAADGSSSGGFGGPFGGGSSDCVIRISGGRLTVNASGDGLDSNGDLIVSGGEVYVSGPTSDGDGALDYDGTATITGGIVVAAGSSGMAQNFGSDSSQGSILLSYAARSQETIRVTDADGNVLIEWTPAKEYNCVVVSCPELKEGGTYTISAAGEEQTITLDSLIYGESGFGGPGGGFPGKDGGFDPPNGDFDPGDMTPPDGSDTNRPEFPGGSNGGTPLEKPSGGSGSDMPQKPGGSSSESGGDQT